MRSWQVNLVLGRFRPRHGLGERPVAHRLASAARQTLRSCLCFVHGHLKPVQITSPILSSRTEWLANDDDCTTEGEGKCYAPTWVANIPASRVPNAYRHNGHTRSCGKHDGSP